MCGIAGFLGGPTWRAGDAQAGLRAMLAPLAPRGPDGEGTFLDEGASCALGHRRLAIIDPSPRGAQPMVSRSGRFVIVFNGEVYQHADLLRRLDDDDRAWCGRSDTAALLAVIDRFGLEPALDGLHSMYALALWDRAERRLSLARDPAGIKPLYVAEGRAGLAFASTMAALRAWPGLDLSLDRSAFALYARFGFWPGARTPFAEARKVEPGEIVSFEGGPGESLGQPRRIARSSRFASPLPAPVVADAASLDATHPSAFARAVDAAERVIEATIAREMIADRPVGLFLSGGIDSSLIGAMMTRLATGPVTSFCARFEEKAIDESAHAGRVAAALGLRHVEVPITPENALDTLETLHAAFDEPLSDMAAVPTLLLAARARREVGVVLTGDGGDEAFGGYDRYRRLIGLEARLARVPALARQWGAAALAGPLGAVAARVAVVAGRAATVGNAATRIERIADVAGDPSRARLYRSLMTLWPDPARLVGAAEPEIEAYAHADRTAAGALDFAQRADLLSYLPEALFVKTDRATMAHGLEARVPLAARAVVALGLSIPEPLRQRDGASKAVLRAVLGRRLDPTLFERPKQGFSVPMAAWLRGPLRAWAEGLIGPSALKATGLFDPGMVGARWTAHQAGQGDFSYSLWAILMAQDFARRLGPFPSRAAPP